MATLSSASAQVCGFIALQAEEKRRPQGAQARQRPLPRVQLAPRRHANPRVEHAEAVRRFEEEVRRYRMDVSVTVREAYRARLATVQKTFDLRMKRAEEEVKLWRERAIAKLEEFVKRFPDDPEHTPVRMGQLGELYYEVASERFNREQDAYTRAIEAYSRAGGKGLEPQPPKQRYERMIALYRKLIERFPRYRDIDGIYYILGYALSSQGDEEAAVKVFEAFAQRFPRSERAPEVWTRLGEYYFEQRPRRLREAIAAYRRALPFTDSQFFDKALYKLGWAHYLDNRFDVAVKRFEELIAFSDAAKARSGRAGSDLRAEAIHYAALSFTDENWGSYQKISTWFGSSPPPYAREILERYGDVLFDATRYKQAIRAYELALSSFPTHPDSPRMLGCQVVAFRLLRDFVSEAKTAGRIARRFGRDSVWYAANRNNKEALRKVEYLAQGSILAAATYHHKQANVFASEGQLGRARQEYSEAADLYRRFIGRFPTAKEAYEITYYLAETLYYAFRFQEAAAIYERVRDHPEKTEHRLEAALGAFKSLENWIEKRRLALPPFPKLDKSGKIVGGKGPITMPRYVLRLLQAGDRFLALAGKHKQAPNVSYVMAETYYKYKVLREARARFQKIIDRWPNHTATLNSARLLVDSYRLTQDWSNVERWSRRLIAAKIASGSERRALIAELGRLKSGALFRKAEALQKAGKHESAAKEYIRLARENPKAEYADLSLFNAGANYEQIRKYESANRVYAMLLKRYPRSKRADRALFRIAANAENFFEFDRAVTAYLRLHRQYPKSDKRAWALYNAALLLENNRQYQRAAGYFLDYAKTFPEKVDAPTSVFRAGKLYVKAKRFTRARAVFKSFIAEYGRDPRYRGLAIDAQAAIADAYDKQGNRLRSFEERRRVIEAFDRSRFPPGSPAAVAAARARFLIVERDFAAYQKRKIRGRAKQQAKTLVSLIKQMREIERDYRGIGRFKVLDWYLAALFRVGQLYQLLSQKMLDAPTPRNLRTQAEKDMYRTQLEDRASVLERKAMSNYEIAHRYGAKRGVSNRWTKRALEALAAINPLKYRVPKEPRSANQLETISPAPIVRALPGAAIPKAGGEWKPAGK